MHGGQQVGYVDVEGYVRASLWSGSASSWEDLHAFLPASFSYSVATGIADDGVNVYIVGYGYNTATQREEALMWVPEPATLLTLGAGLAALALRRRRN